jgi:hypothetical protein
MPRVSLRSALRAPTPGLRFSPPHKSPPPGIARRESELSSFRRDKNEHRISKGVCGRVAARM